MNYIIGGLSLNIEEQGEGEASLVFLHYWGGSLRTWDGVVETLRNSFRCITYDVRGWGKSGAAASYTLQDMASDAANLIKTLGLSRFVLVGHSMGGKVAQLLASRKPAGLIGMILVAPAPPIPITLPEEVREQQLHAYDNRENVLQALDFLCAKPIHAEVLERAVEDSLSGSREAVLAWPNSGLSEDISSELPKITVPTLILAGEQDRLDSIEQHRLEVQARIANSRLQIVIGSGHLVPIDEPQQLARLIQSFVADLS